MSCHNRQKSCAINAFCEYECLYFTTISAPAQDVAKRVWSDYHHPTLTVEDEEFFFVQMKEDRDQWFRLRLGYKLEHVEFDLHWAYWKRPPDGWEWQQLLFWEPRNRPGFTVMMGNSQDGNQHATGPSRQSVPWKFAFVCIQDRGNCPQSFVLEYFANYEKTERIIHAQVDDDRATPKWVFDADGPVQKFENPAYYKRRKIADRLNRAILTEYLLKMGYDIQSDDFWTTDQPAWLIWYDAGGKKSRPVRYSVNE